MHKSSYLHASYSYNPTRLSSYFYAVFDLFIAKTINAKNITFHLPIEISFPSKINIPRAKRYIYFIERLSKIINIPVVWENITFLSTKDWSVLEQSVWEYIPKDIDLCLDTGHLMLGEKNPQKRISEVIVKFGKQIKHLHIHENDLIHDLHLPPEKIINQKMLKEIIKNRTWIIEPQS